MRSCCACRSAPPRPISRPEGLRFAWSGPPAQTLETAERYVAVYTLDRRWRDPVFETLAAVGAELKAVPLAPGRYRAVCSAVGLGMVFTQPFEVEPQRPRELNCRLPGLVTRPGRVLDGSSGDPISGVKIGPAEFFRAGRAAGAERYGHGASGAKLPLPGPMKPDTLPWPVSKTAPSTCGSLAGATSRPLSRT